MDAIIEATELINRGEYELIENNADEMTLLLVSDKRRCQSFQGVGQAVLLKR